MGDVLVKPYLRLGNVIADSLGKALPPETVAWYLANPDQVSQALMRGFVADNGTHANNANRIATNPWPKFELFADLGEFKVPSDYDHDTQLTRFREWHHRKDIFVYDECLTDAHFPWPSRVLQPGERLSLRAFRQIVPTTTSAERLAFLATQGAVYAGAQCASLVLGRRYPELDGRMFSSMDEKAHLYASEGKVFVPCGRVVSDQRNDGSYPWFCVQDFKDPWSADVLLLCLNELG